MLQGKIGSQWPSQRLLLCFPLDDEQEMQIFLSMPESVKDNSFLVTLSLLLEIFYTKCRISNTMFQTIQEIIIGVLECDLCQ